jgi:hypothetical protein
MALVARRQKTTPAAVYSATVHALLGSMSQALRSLVQMHIDGRTREERDIIGCYHRILPVSVDLSDHPDLATLIKRVSIENQRTQLRSRIGYLTLGADSFYRSLPMHGLAVLLWRCWRSLACTTPWGGSWRHGWARRPHIR